MYVETAAKVTAGDKPGSEHMQAIPVSLPAQPLETEHTRGAHTSSARGSRIPGRLSRTPGASHAATLSGTATTKSPAAAKRQLTQPRLPFSDARNREAQAPSQRRTKAWLAKLGRSEEGAPAGHPPADVAELRARQGHSRDSKVRGPPQWSVAFAPLPDDRVQSALETAGCADDAACCPHEEQENVAPFVEGSSTPVAEPVGGEAEGNSRTLSSTTSEPVHNAALVPTQASPGPRDARAFAATSSGPGSVAGKSSPAFVQSRAHEPASKHHLARAQPGGVSRELARRTAAVKSSSPAPGAASPMLHKAAAAAAATCATSFAPHERVYAQLPALPDASAASRAAAAAASRHAESRRLQAAQWVHRSDVLPPAMCDLWNAGGGNDEVRAGT